MDNNNHVHGMMYRNSQNVQNPGESNSFFAHHMMDNANKIVNKEMYPMNECNDQNDDGYETGVSDMMSMKYKHHPSFTTLPPSSPFSSISSISSTTPTSFASSQQQQSPIYNIGSTPSYHYHHQQQQQQPQYQQTNPMMNPADNGQQYGHHLPNSMYGNSQNDPYNFAAHEYQQLQNFGELHNEGKVMMSLDSQNAKYNQQQKFFGENGTKENHSDFYPHMMTEKSGMEISGAIKSETVKKRGRKRKNDEDNNSDPIDKPKGRRKHDKFNGMSEEEVIQRFLPDQLTFNLDVVIIGINPGLFAAYKGHYFAGPGNHFWKCMYLSELTPTQMTAEEDYRLLERGIGFTNIVSRPTKGSADLTRKEIKDGCTTLLEKLQKFQPKVAVFNGKLIYEVFSGKKDFYFGKQAELVEGTNTHIWVMPSSSARCAQLPRAADKVPFYASLKKFKDYLNGLVPEYVESDYVFTDPKYNQLTSPSSELDQSMNPEECFDENQADIKRKKRGRPKKKNDGNESIDCKQTKELDGELSDDKLNGSKKKRGRPKKSAVNGESPVKAPKKSKKNAEQKTNTQSERSSISPMMESSSSFSNSLSSSHQQPVPVQQAQQQQQNGKCNQTSRSQSPSFNNMCHQPNLEMKPMMHGNAQFNHNQPQQQQQQSQQDTNITYRHQVKSHESPMTKEDHFENLNLDELPMFNSNAQVQPEFKSQIPTNTNPITQNNIEKMPKMNGLSGDNNNMKYHQQQQPQQHYQNDLGNNQLNLASQQQQQQQQQSFHRQQLPPVQQIQQSNFHTSTPHLISNITSDTRNVYQQQHVQRPEPTAYAMSNVSIPPEKAFTASNQPAAAQQAAPVQTQQAKDISLKSLSGLESLVDQISNANPDQEITATAAPTMPAAPTPSYPTPYGHGAQHYFHPSHPQNHGQGFPSGFPPIGSFPNPSYSSFGNYHQNLMSSAPHHVGMPVNPVYTNSGYPPHPSTLIPYGNSYPAGSFNPQGSSNYYNSMFDRLNF